MNTSLSGLGPILALASSLWLAGCAGNGGSLTRYLLPGPEDSQAMTAAAPSDEQLLLVRPVEVAPYLAVEGIVLQLDGIVLNAARDHQWAAPLAHQLRRGLRERLAARLPNTRVVADPEGLPPRTLVLQVEVDHFLGRHDGYALASGRWQLRTKEGGKVLVLESFHVETPLQADGYPALVHALGESWDQVAAEIAEAVRQHR